ncbi:AAA family ATPase [Methylobacterium sp. AMS5]|uniref:AAA family ATPase n=1 Tax=Methylobacterium sp. AMS5 TaxID=925818 RepID=UPI00074F83A5|nr:AAA family ATPase [Methylobacterium sp. AMS5]AMB48358.1 recombinase RecF [Methylobacterium sp. AMS5]
MKFPKIEIENFGTIRKASLALADRGLVLIQGVNEVDTSADSNGSGKSTLPDALAWCFYGTTARGVEGDAVINNQVGKQCRVAATVLDGDDSYLIARHRKHKAGKNRVTVVHTDKAGTVTDLTKGTDKLTQEIVNQILGCTWEVFVGAIYAGQDQMPDLPGMTDKNLKVVVEEAAGATVLEKGYRIALGDVQKAKADLAAAGHTLALRQQALENEKDRIAFDLTSDIERWEQKRKDHIEGQTARVRVLVGEVKALKGRATIDRPAVEKQLHEAEAQIAAVEIERKRERELIEEEQAASIAAARTDTNARQLARDAKREKEILDSLAHQVGCPCRSCDRPFSAEDIAPAQTKQQGLLNDALRALRDAKAAHETALKSHQSVTERLEAYRASMTDVSATNALCDALRASLRDDDRLQADIRAKSHEARTIKEGIDRLKAEVNPHLAAKERSEAKVLQLEQEVKDAIEHVGKATVALEVAEAVAKVFAPAGARAELLDEITPFLNSQTAKYLGALSDGNCHATWSTLTKDAKGNLKERFAIDVTHDQGGDEFAAISGGEKRKVRIAAAMALQDLVASRATKPIDLFIGDEIDNALCPAGIERLTMILEEKARERGTVFIISHSDLKDWVRNTIVVRKKARGDSVIEEIAA